MKKRNTGTTNKQALTVAETDRKHPDSPAATSRKAAADAQAARELESARSTSPATSDSGSEFDPLDSSNSVTPEGSVSGDEEVKTPDAPEPKKANPMLGTLLYSGMFMCGIATVLYIYYATVLKSQSGSNSKFSISGISESISKLLSSGIAR